MAEPESAGEANIDLAPVQAISHDVAEPGWNAGRVVNIMLEKPKREVRQRIDELQDEFNIVLLKAQYAFENHQVPLTQLRTLVTSLSVSQKQNIPMFNETMLEVINTSTCAEIFCLLTRIEVWDILNFRVLQKIVKHFIPQDDQIHACLEEYSAKVNIFKPAVTLPDYIRVRASGTTPIPGTRSIMIKIDRSYRGFTLANVEEQEQFLADQFLLNQFIFRFSDGGRGCVRITWLVPASAIKLLKPEKLAMKAEALKEKKILEIRVDDRYVYINPESKDAPRELIPASSTEDYSTMYKASIENADEFWSEQALKFLDWDEMFQKTNDSKKEKGIVRWFTGGKLNVSKNCLDRHADKTPHKTAIIWEKNNQKHEKISYRELLEQTCRLANVLRNQCKVEKGDIVVIYMPAMPLAVAAMLACARIGAVHSVVYAVLPPEKLQKLILSNVKVIITADEAPIGATEIPLKKKVDRALSDGSTSIQHVLVARRTGTAVEMVEGRDLYLDEVMMRESSECEPMSMDSEDDLFIMYTSGVTDNPTGIVHTQAGYLLYAAITHKYVFDYQEGDIFACVAVLGWITGHTYVVYGPLCNGATTVLFEGTATYPDQGRYWEMVERLKINQFYTTASAIRMLMKSGDKYVSKYDLSSLKTIGSVGEPLSVEGWKWYFEVVGKEKCILVDTWWQTETGGIAISPQPGPTDGKLKPGCTMRPFFGVEPVLINEKGDELEGNGVQGLLCLRNPTPGMGRKIITPHKNFKDDYFSYFSSNPGLYFTQDYAYKDVDGDYQIQGRKDDIIRIKGVWLQVPEIESSIVQSDSRIEAAALIPISEPTKDRVTVKRNKSTAVMLKVKSDTGKKDRTEIYKKIVTDILDKQGLGVTPQVYFTDREPMTASGKVNRLIMKQEVIRREQEEEPFMRPRSERQNSFSVCVIEVR